MKIFHQLKQKQKDFQFYFYRIENLLNKIKIY